MKTLLAFGFALLLASPALGQPACPDTTEPDVFASFDMATGEWTARVQTCPFVGNAVALGAVAVLFNGSQIDCVPAVNDQTFLIGWTATQNGEVRVRSWEFSDCTGTQSILSHNRAIVQLAAPSAPLLLPQP